jgi:hypothetical protein
MRAIQKIIITVYGILVAVACIYVPWETRILLSGEGVPVSLGYSLLWRPLLDASVAVPKSFASTVDIKRVILELIAITAVFAIFFVLTKEKGGKNE